MIEKLFSVKKVICTIIVKLIWDPHYALNLKIFQVNLNNLKNTYLTNRYVSPNQDSKTQNGWTHYRLYISSTIRTKFTHINVYIYSYIPTSCRCPYKIVIQLFCENITLIIDISQNDSEYTRYKVIHILAGMVKWLNLKKGTSQVCVMYKYDNFYQGLKLSHFRVRVFFSVSYTSCKISDIEWLFCLSVDTFYTTPFYDMVYTLCLSYYTKYFVVINGHKLVNKL